MILSTKSSTDSLRTVSADQQNSISTKDVDVGSLTTKGSDHSNRTSGPSSATPRSNSRPATRSNPSQQSVDLRRAIDADEAKPILANAAGNALNTLSRQGPQAAYMELLSDLSKSTHTKEQASLLARASSPRDAANMSSEDMGQLIKDVRDSNTNQSAHTRLVERAENGPLADLMRSLGMKSALPDNASSENIRAKPQDSNNQETAKPHPEQGNVIRKRKPF